MSETSEQFFCRHEDIDSQGFCRKCHARAAIKLETAPTQLEKSAIDRALWSEIGLAIGRIEANLQKAEKSREIERQAQEQWFLALASDNKAREAFEAQLAERLCGLEGSLRHLHGKFALLNSRVAPIAQPKRKRERKGKR